MRQAALILLMLGVAGCASHPPRGGGRFADGHGPARGTVFISPMGEPFRGPGGGEAQVSVWFDAADTNHDGRLTLVEFQADAARFFQSLDTDHDGEIDPAELRHYEEVVAPEIRVGGAGGGGARPSGRPSGGRGGGGHGGGGMGGGRGGGHGGGGGGGGSAPAAHDAGGQVEGAGRFGFFGYPEPVAAADANFNRSITAAEFAAAAHERFSQLDLDSNGLIDRAELPRRAGRDRRSGRPMAE